MLHGKALGGAILLVLLGGCAPSGKETRTLADAPATAGQETAQPAEPVTTAPPATAGVRVFIDPATGLQRAPTAEEWAAMVAQEKIRKEASIPPPAPTEMILPDGTRGYVLGNSSKTSARACKHTDGGAKVTHDDCPGSASDPSSNDATNGKAP